MRTIKQFINSEKKVYFYLKDTETCRAFFEKAHEEGLTLGGEDPRTKDTSDMIALLPHGELCYVGWAGRMCYHNASSSGALRIDYDSYAAGNADYLVK